MGLAREFIRGERLGLIASTFWNTPKRTRFFFAA